MRIPKYFTTFFLCALFVVCAAIAQAAQISGTISTTMTITEDSQLVDDVTCTVTGAPCIAIGASHVTLDLNGFTMTGLGDGQTGCSGTENGGEIGIDVNGQTGVVIRGPGVVQQFRNHGIRLNGGGHIAVTGVTTSTNCLSGIFVTGGSSDNQLDRNISVRNGSLSARCGGI